MNLSEESNGDAERQRFTELLDKAGARGLRIPFWWRDDDAETATPALDRLLRLAAKYQVPLALAVVPRNATTALAERLASEPDVSVLQHGWQHRNHAPEGAKKEELGDHRPTTTVIDELRLGFNRLSALFPEKFLPVLVPPWNRIANGVRERRADVGLTGHSVFGQAPANEPYWVNPHLDIFEWRPTRRPVERATAYAVLSAELERRLAGDPEPIGIMTHHLVHDDESWELLDDLLALLSTHPATIWKSASELFGLPQRIA